MIAIISTMLLALHIVAGFIALATGGIALAASKGRNTHNLSGRIFFYAMMLVTLTALLLSLIKDLSFLLMIAVFSGYMAYTGYRAMHFFRKQKHLTIIDKTLWGCATLFALWMLLHALQLSFPLPSWQFRFDSFALILMVFGLILGRFVLQDFFACHSPSTSTKNQWLPLHIVRMCGAYIATFTAFLVVNVTVQPAFIPWLLPTLLGTPLISYFIRKYQTKPTII